MRALTPCFLLTEHVCSIIASMLRNLKGQQRSRLLSKFTENDCEKVKIRQLTVRLYYLLLLYPADGFNAAVKIIHNTLWYLKIHLQTKNNRLDYTCRLLCLFIGYYEKIRFH